VLIPTLGYFKYTDKAFPYVPHITIAKCVDKGEREGLNNLKRDRISSPRFLFTVCSITLFKRAKKGEVWQEVATFSF